MTDFIKQAANVVPSKKQLDWFELEQYAFIHFGLNTYTDKEWGDGTEAESIFNPTRLDCDQWVEAIKSAGLKGMVLTAKHHGTPEYNDYFCNQLTELLTGYGEIFHVWFDNACGEGENGIKQEYDFERYFELIRKYQPNATIYNDFGPDVRWCGNEAGSGRECEWAVVPHELCKFSRKQTEKGPLSDKGNLSFIFNTNSRIGGLHQIIFSNGLAFVPSEIDTSLRKGWFWHESEDPKSIEELFNIYLNSVGNNACLNLNIPPNKDGLIDEKDILMLKKYGDFIKNTFSSPVSYNMQTDDENELQPEYTLDLNKPVSELKYVVLAEDISKGQRVDEFMIYPDKFGGSSFPLYKGGTIGNKKICCLQNPFAEQNPLLADNIDTYKLKIKIVSARDKVQLKDIKVY